MCTRNERKEGNLFNFITTKRKKGVLPSDSPVGKEILHGSKHLPTPETFLLEVDACGSSGSTKDASKSCTVPRIASYPQNGLF